MPDRRRLGKPGTRRALPRSFAGWEHLETHMRTRTLFLTVLAGGPLLGALAGLAVDTRMSPPPEPYWRHLAAPVQAPGAFSYLGEQGPQDTSPYVSDRTPTWKRHLARGEPVYAPVPAEPAPDEAPAPAVAALQDAAQAGAAPGYGLSDVPPAPAPEPQPEAGGDSAAIVL
jgi:hypothetical protein